MACTHLPQYTNAATMPTNSAIVPTTTPLFDPSSAAASKELVNAAMDQHPISHPVVWAHSSKAQCHHNNNTSIITLG